ncbi:MAG: DUF1566 domain-containing protein [Burkholderiales bacterium]
MLSWSWFATLWVQACRHAMARGSMLLAWIACMLCVSTAHAAGAPTPPEWLTTSDGAFVVHLSAGMAWPRCVEGQRWTGKRCEGQALLLTQSEALALARSRTQADGVAWRLPTVKELQRLAEQGLRADARPPWLPGGNDAWCWTGTSTVDTSAVNEYSYGNVMHGVTGQNMTRVRFLHAWAVNASTAEVRKDVLKRTPLNVRLVRPVD